MNMATKNTIYQEHINAYRHGSKAERSAILDAVCRVVGLARKSAIRRFHTLLVRSPYWHDRRSGQVRYGQDVTVALKDIWELAGRICAERLHGKVGEYIKQSELANRWPHDSETGALLLRMSVGTMKSRIIAFDNPTGRPGRGTTKPSVLKEIVPIRRGPWDSPSPGFGEIDTVAHCGDSIGGDFTYTVQYTDVATIWTCLAAQWNKGETATLQSIQTIQKRLPFRLAGLDPDSGTEFINWHLVGWAAKQAPAVQLSRTRPYMKNDHARIEQKNYVNVRKWVGYQRFDDVGYVPLLNELYRTLEDYLNFFIPSVKCIAKEKRPNQRTKRRYDRPATAYERVLARADVAEETKARLKAKYAILSMVELKGRIDQFISKLTALRHKRLW